MATEEKKKISALQHPVYSNWLDDWQKYRAAFEGGKAFVTGYLQKYSTRETDEDYDLRIAMSYCPAHAKSTILEVKNSIYQRLVTVTRQNGPTSYQEAVEGKNRGVDLQGRTMDDFIGSVILEELIVLGKVGVYIDKPVQEETDTLLESEDIRPYLYYYTAEAIKAWAYNDQQELVSLLLQDSRDVVDEETGLVTEQKVVFRHLRLTDDGVDVTFYDDKDEIIGSSHLDLAHIPFVLFEISSSLMVDVADYQIALTQLASSDMKYSVEANFPFYVEQFNDTFEFTKLKGAQPADDGGKDDAKTSKDKEITVGTSKGRRYPQGLERPGFIHPSSEPLLASMQKQEALQKEIRQIVNVSIANLEPTRSSEESKKQDQTTLEAGLSYIGMELGYGEREIAKIWAMYEGSSAEAIVKYPTDYKLLTDDERRKEAKDAEEMMGKIPSKTYKQEMTKRIVKLTLGTTATPDILDKINKEIDSAVVIISDPDVIRSDHEAGLVGDELASRSRGYPEGEHLKAQADKAKRAAATLAAQTSPEDDAANKGVNDLSDNPNAGKEEKANQQNADANSEGETNTRGDKK